MGTSSRSKVREFRQRRREQGWRKVEMWVPDLRKPEVAARIREQCLRIAASAAAAEDQAFIDSVNDEMFAQVSATEDR
jgi:hypothetical protein